MTKIKGLELKNVKEFTGEEGYGFTAAVYMDGKEIGTAQDYAYGAGSYATVDSKFAEEFQKRCDQFVAESKDVDSFEIYKMTPEEYKKNRAAGTLPVKKEHVLSSEEEMLEALMEARRIEKAVKKGLKIGSKEYVEVNFISLRNTPCPKDLAFYADGSEEMLKQIEAEAEKKSDGAKGCPYEIKRYDEKWLKDCQN